jgi:hypothetical protein
LIRNITIEELQELIRSTMKEELQNGFPKKGEPSYISRDEAADLLRFHYRLLIGIHTSVLLRDSELAQGFYTN